MAEYPVMSTSQGTYVRIEQTFYVIRDTYEICTVWVGGGARGLGLQNAALENGPPTKRNLCQMLASQYDPLGFILPYTTRVKILIQKLWAKPKEWGNPLFPNELLQSWPQWEDNLKFLSSITFPRCYVTPEMDNDSVVREIHVFSLNPAEDLTKGKSSHSKQMDNGTPFLLMHSDHWPKSSADSYLKEDSELHKSMFCALNVVRPPTQKFLMLASLQLTEEATA